MRKPLIFTFCLFIIGSVSCNRTTPTPNRTVQQQAKALFRRAVNLTFEQPDAALATIDSVLLLSEQYNLDTFYISGLVRRSLLLSEKRLMPEARALARKALDLWKPSDGIFALCKANEQMGQCLIVEKNYEEAIGYFNKELELAPQCGEKALGIESYAAGYIANILSFQQKYKESLQYYERSNTCAEKIGDKTSIAANYNDMSSLFKKLGAVNEELACLRKAAVCFDSTDYRRAATYLNLANTFSFLNQPDSANYYILKAYQTPHTNPQIRLISMVGYGSVLTEKKAFQAAHNLMKQAITLADSIGDGERKGIALHQIAETYFAEKNPTEAINYVSQAIAVLEDKETAADFVTRFEASKNLIRFQLGATNHPEMIKNLEQMIDFKDSINVKENTEILAGYRMQIKSDSLSLLSANNQTQQAVIANRNLLLLLVSAASVLLSGLAFFWRRNLLLSKENLEILEVQNQKLNTDNTNLLAAIQDIRQNNLSDKTSMLEKSLTLPTRNNLMLKLGDIMYIKAMGGGVQYFCTTKNHLVWHSFEESMKMLPEEFFIKIHRSFIVNRIFIEQVSPSKVMLKNGQAIPIGITFNVEVKERLSPNDLPS